ncbi:MAG: histidine kinase, partial [Cytophaga sp.]|nr:histidine kinase [Cytophaga sp.]
FLIQIMENLISNAIKFSEKGKKIEVSIKSANNKIQISVRDQGQGLTPEDLQNLFKKFQRLSARPTDGENSLGLGLSIVKKYVDLMDGKIWCESQPNKGAEFIIEFDKG